VADVQRLGEYRIDREIARSSIASIYEGYQESLDRKVLIKRLHPQLVGDAEIRARFEREARAIARIKHKNIVHIYDYRADDDLVLLVSEWISGGTLEELVRNEGPLTEREAVALCLDMLEGLAVAHENGIIHRDIKPSNLLISHSGAIKITDFGLAQFEGSPNLTQQGVVMGTPAYMAPELVSGSPADARSDLYGVGITVYELMSGVNPFRSDSMSQTLNRVTSLKPEPLEGVLPEFSDFLLHLMDKRPDRRPQSAREALAQIRAIATQLDVERGWAAIERTAREDDESRTRIRPVSRPTPRIGLVVLAWVLMLGITGSLLLFLPEHEEPSLPPAPVTQDTVNTQTPPSTATTTPTPRDTGRTGSEDTLAERPGTPPPETLEQKPEPPQPKPEPVTGTSTGEMAESTSPDTTTQRVSDTASRPDTLAAAPMPQGDGYLYLSVHPWANVYLQDQLLAQTPYNKALKLPSGDVALTLINPEFPPITETVHIVANDTVRARVNLFERVGTIEFIDATPWAEVYLDGDYLGRTPIGKPTFVKPGTHDLSFRHPNLPDRVISFDITPGGEPRRFSVDLTTTP